MSHPVSRTDSPSRHVARRTLPVGSGLSLLLLFLAMLGGCQRQAPLPAELALIQCPADQSAHARGTFGKAELTFVCISKRLAGAPHLLRCDLESLPMICEDAGTFAFHRDDTGKVFSGSVQARNAKGGLAAGEAFKGSGLVVNFRNAPPNSGTFDETETDWHFLLPGGPEFLPAGFVFVKGTRCARESTVLGTGTCNFEARSASLYWHFELSVPRERGTQIAPEEYAAELVFWRRIFAKLVVDPKR